MTTLISGVAALLISCVAYLLRDSWLQSIEFGSVADWVSGLATFAAVWVALNANGLLKSQREAERRAQARMNTEQISLKLIGIGDDLMTLRGHTVARRRTVTLDGKDGVTEFNFIDKVFGHNPDRTPLLTPSEAGELIGVGAASQAREINLLCKRLAVHHNSLVSYSKELDALDAMTPHLSGYKAVKGNSIKESRVQEELEFSALSQLTDLQFTSDELEKRIASDLLLACDVCDELLPFLKLIVQGETVLLPDTSTAREQDIFPAKPS